MMRSGAVSRARAEELAMRVMRTNAGELYGLSLGSEGVGREHATPRGEPSWVEQPAPGGP